MVNPLRDGTVVSVRLSRGFVPERGIPKTIIKMVQTASLFGTRY